MARISIIIAAAITALTLHSQALISPNLNVQFFDDAGRPLANGFVRSCAAGSSCPGSEIPTFTSSSGFTANQNPIRLSASGRASIWLTAATGYKFVVSKSTGEIVTGAGGDNIFGASISTSGGGGGGGTPGGANTNVQFNSFGTFGGSSTFTWDDSAKTLTVTGVAATPSIVSAGGFIQSSGGFLASCAGGGSWQCFNTNTDGALLRGLSLAQNAANTKGGYLNLAPVTYNPYDGSPCLDASGNPVQQPLPLNGLANFGTHNAILWVGTSPQMPPGGSCGAALPIDLDYGLNLNTYFFARGGLATDNGAYNAINTVYLHDGIPAGGVTAGSVTAGTLYPTGTVTTSTTLTMPTYLGGYIQAGHSADPPAAGTIATVTNPLTGGDGLEQGTLFWDDTNNCLSVYDGSMWACLGGGGGGGTPGGVTTNVQFNNAGSFGGSANLTWSNVGRVLTATTATSATAGMVVANGFMQADAGFLATTITATNYNAFQAAGGGMAALSFTAVNYIQAGNSSGVPALTTSDTFHAGALYFDTGTHQMKVFDDSAAWVTLATGGATSPGGATTNIQFNSAGSFAGSSNLIYAAQNLTSIASSSSTAGITVGTGYAQADQGFLATPAVAVKYNVIQAPTGGMEALSFTAVNYLQTGSFNSGGAGGMPTLTMSDAFHPGALSWDTFGAGSLKVYNGATWVAVGGAGSSAAGPTTSIQYNNAGAFAGDSTLTWNTGSRNLTVTTAGVTAGISVANGFIQSDTGFLATIGTATRYNAIQAPGGGMFAKSGTFTSYIQTGSSAGAPTLTTGDSFQTGALYYDTIAAAPKVWNGFSWSTLSTGGISSLNGLTGALSIACAAASSCSIGASGVTVTITSPQPLATTSGVTFASVIANGVFNSTVTGATIGFQTSTGSFQVSGAGAVSAAGVISSTGAGGGFNNTGNAATNSVQTVGGVNSGSTGSANGGYSVNGARVINNSAQWIGAAVLSSGNVATNGVFAVGPSGGPFAFGQTATIIVSGCTMTFTSGILTGHSGTC